MLTIAIPTYNRHAKLDEQLAALVPQIEENVRVMVLDNCSEPPVCEVLPEDILQQVKIVRNVVNVGADANICRCFELCETPWLWVLSDDDLVNGNAVLTVLEEISAHPSAVFINVGASSSYTTRGLCALLEKKPDYSNSFFISNCLYNASVLKPYLGVYYSFLSSMHGQLILVLKYLEAHPDAESVFSRSILHVSRGVGGWCRLLFIDRLPLFLSAFSGRSRQLVETAFGNSIAWHILHFANNLLLSGEMSPRQYCHLFRVAATICPSSSILRKNILKQILLGGASLISKRLGRYIVARCQAGLPE